MDILALNKYWLNLIDARPAQAISTFTVPWILLLLKNILISSLMLSHLIPTISFFAENITSLAKSTAAFYVIGVMVIFLSTYWNLLANRTRLDGLIYDLEDMQRRSNHFEKSIKYKMSINFNSILGSKWDRNEVYAHTKVEVGKITKLVFYLFFISVPGSFCVPFAVAAFHLINGTYSPEVWVLPMEIL